MLWPENHCCGPPGAKEGFQAERQPVWMFKDYVLVSSCVKRNVYSVPSQEHVAAFTEKNECIRKTNYM